MSKLTNMINETRGFNGYLTMQQLSESAIVFCVTAISTREGKFGQQWELTIRVDDDSAAILEMGEWKHAKVTVNMGQRSKTNRDKLIEAMSKDLPVHRVMVDDGVELKNEQHSIYYNFIECSIDVPCGCGLSAGIEEGDSTETHPF